MIIYEKAIKKFSKKELRKILPVLSGRKFLQTHKIKLEVSSNIPYYKIGYSLEDFQKDYPIAKKWKEKEFFYHIYANGETINSLLTKYDISSGTIRRSLEEGVIYEGKSRNFYHVFKYTKADEILWERYKIIFFKNHTEVYGEKEELEYIIKYLQIDKEAIWEPFKESFHIAFGGNLSLYVKKRIENKKRR